MNPSKFRAIAFAMLMSTCTVTLVSGCVLLANGVSNADFFHRWIKSSLLAWPIVLIAILTIAPMINKLLDYIFDRLGATRFDGKLEKKKT